MQDKSIMWMPLVLILALGISGYGFAHWSDTVQIEGTVNMGSSTLAFDPDEWLDWIDIEELTGDKDIGWADMYYDVGSYIEDVHTGKYGYKTLIIEFHNAYPQYEVHFTTVVVHNIGTLPLDIVGLSIRDPTGELNWEWQVPPPAHESYGFFWKDFDGDTVYDEGEEEIMNVLIKNFVSTQLEPCDSTKGEVDIDFKQPAEECHTYYLEITIEAVES